MNSAAIDGYFESKLHKPFYMVVGDQNYKENYASLLEKGTSVIRLSDCFNDSDKLPDMDMFREKLRTIDVNCETNKAIVIGLGEYLLLKGSEYSYTLLDELKDFNLGSAQVIFLLRGMGNIVSKISKNDVRFDDRRFLISDDIETDIRLVISSRSLSLFDNNGLKDLCLRFENGDSGEIKVNSDLRFEGSLIPVSVMESSYDGIVRKIPDFCFPSSLGSEEYWSKLLKELEGCEYSIDGLFISSDHSPAAYTNTYEKLARDDYGSWKYFLHLLLVGKEAKHSYLRYVAQKSKTPAEFLKNILYLIIEVPHTAPDYTIFYNERKNIIKNYPESEIAQFIVENRKISSESIYKLTDNTEVEREEIVSTVSRNGTIKELNDIYPMLSLYLEKYSFPGDAFSSRLSEYFNKYRQLKVANKIDEDFLNTVDEYARTRQYNRLRKRDELVASLDDGKSYLCWVDALGAEYTGFIVGLAKSKGLAVSVNIGRANLPTITSENRAFYDNWSEGYKNKIDDLDETKHKEKGGFKWTDNQLPIHLAKELSILSQVVDQAATVLGLRKYDRYILAGDHGASRLAVLRNKEEKYETDTKGEHSGRCCRLFEYSDLPFATEENGYVVLADYGRFSGSRKANVEVHGGASLEEVCVPVIELKLKDNELVIELVDDEIVTDHKLGTQVRFFTNKNITECFTLEINGKKYNSNKIDSNHYDIDLPDIKKAGTYIANILLDDKIHTSMELHIVGKSGSVNNDFDDIFS